MAKSLYFFRHRNGNIYWGTFDTQHGSPYIWLFRRRPMEPDDVKSRDYFIAQNDYAIQTLGRHTAWRFASFDGGPLPMYADEPENRCDDLWIVSTWEFDYGFASKKRYGHIEGFGTALNQEKTDVSHS